MDEFEEKKETMTDEGTETIKEGLNEETYTPNFIMGEVIEETGSGTESNPDPNEQSVYRYGYDEDAAAHDNPQTAKPKKHIFKKISKFLATAACFGLVAGSVFYGVNYAADKVFDSNVTKEITTLATDAANAGAILNTSTASLTIASTKTTDSSDSTAASDDVVVKVVADNMAATVAICSTYTAYTSYWGQYYSQEAVSKGSGFIVGANDTELLIATNNHVIDNSEKIEVTFIDDTVHEAVVKGTDATADLAIIAVSLDDISDETMSSIKIATLGDSEAVQLGEMCIVIGNALGYGQSVTVGYVSAKDRVVTIDDVDRTLLQTDAAINGGNSGGPMFNTNGEVIGISSAKYSDTSVEGMCFAIPISRAIPILNELMNRETLADEDKGFLGITGKTVTADVASFYGWPQGAYVYTVNPDSAAERAGIYAGDIITKVNNVSVSSIQECVKAVNSYKYGTTVKITLMRNVDGTYEEITLDVTLEKAGASSSSDAAATPTEAPASSGKKKNK